MSAEPAIIPSGFKNDAGASRPTVAASALDCAFAGALNADIAIESPIAPNNINKQTFVIHTGSLLNVIMYTPHFE
jgi:hypothetical protein